MKKILLPIAILITTCSLSAQITLTIDDMPGIGDVQATVFATNPSSVTPGNPGSNQTYDFSFLVAEDDTSFTSFVPLAGTPGENVFTEAEFAASIDGTFSYVDLSANELTNIGVSLDTSEMGDYLNVPISPSQKLFEIPTTFGTSFLDESAIRITLDGSDFMVDSVRIINRTIRDVNIDGYGTVITPLGAFSGLREQVIATSFDTIQGLFLGTWIDFQAGMSVDTTFSYYSKDSKGPLVTIDIENGEVSDANYLILTPSVAPPVAAFSFTDQGAAQFAFEDQSSNFPTEWLWDFGDGNTSTQQNPTHTYAGQGTYNVCLTVTNSAGSDTACESITLDLAPTAAFSFDIQPDGTVNFTDESTNDPLSWDWDFSDGNTSIAQNPTHTFGSPGAYNVCLTVTNNFGTDELCQDLIIVLSPIADFSYTDVGDSTIAFTDLSQNNPVTWSWDFDDGSTSTEQNPTHMFSLQQNYNVCLTVENPAGSNTNCQMVEVILINTEDLTSRVTIQIGPNPTSNFVRFQLHSEWQELLEFELFNTLGQRVLSQNMNTNGSFDLRMSQFSSGSYFYTLKTPTGQLVKSGKIAKQ